jgi:hypothetical protein
LPDKSASRGLTLLARRPDNARGWSHSVYLQLPGEVAPFAVLFGSPLLASAFYSFGISR